MNGRQRDLMFALAIQRLSKSQRQKAAPWKRAVLILFAAVSCGIGVPIGIWVSGDTLFQQSGKWVLCGAFVGCGIWFLVIGWRGHRLQVDTLVDRTVRAMMDAF